MATAVAPSGGGTTLLAAGAAVLSGGWLVTYLQGFVRVWTNHLTDVISFPRAWIYESIYTNPQWIGFSYFLLTFAGLVAVVVLMNIQRQRLSQLEVLLLTAAVVPTLLYLLLITASVYWD